MRETALLLAALALPVAAGAQDWRGPAAIEVQVEDAKGRNLGGAEVLLVYLSPDGGGSLPSVLTGADGRVTIGGLAAGRWSAEIRHSGHMSYRAELGISVDGKPSVQSASHVMAPGATSTMKVKFSRGRAGASAPAAAAPPSPVPPPVAERTPVKETRSPAATTPPTAAPVPPAAAPLPVAAAEKAPVKELPPGAPAAPAPRPSPTPAAAKPASPAVPAAPVPAATAERAPVKAVPPVPTVAPTPAPVPAPAATEVPAKELPPVPSVASAPAPMPAPVAAKAPAKELPPVPAVAPSPASAAPAPVPTAPPGPAPAPVPAVIKEKAPAKELPAVAPVAPAPAPAAAPPTVAPAPAKAPAPFAPSAAPSAAPVVATVVAPVAAPPSAPPGAPARARLCVECPPGESAAWGEAAIDGGATAGCPADLAARMKSVELSAVAELSAGLAASGAGCRVIAVELPAGARFTGFRYEAQSAGVAADCLPGRGCPAGGCRFPIEPVLRVEGNRTTLLVAFESTAPDLRRAVVAGYSTYNKR